MIYDHGDDHARSNDYFFSLLSLFLVPFGVALGYFHRKNGRRFHICRQFLHLVGQNFPKSKSKIAPLKSMEMATLKQCKSDYTAKGTMEAFNDDSIQIVAEDVKSVRKTKFHHIDNESIELKVELHCPSPEMVHIGVNTDIRDLVNVSTNTRKLKVKNVHTSTETLLWDILETGYCEEHSYRDSAVQCNDEILVSDICVQCDLNTLETDHNYRDSAIQCDTSDKVTFDICTQCNLEDTLVESSELMDSACHEDSEGTSGEDTIAIQCDLESDDGVGEDGEGDALRNRNSDDEMGYGDNSTIAIQCDMSDDFVDDDGKFDLQQESECNNACDGDSVNESETSFFSINEEEDSEITVIQNEYLPVIHSAESMDGVITLQIDPDVTFRKMKF